MTQGDVDGRACHGGRHQRRGTTADDLAPTPRVGRAWAKSRTLGLCGHALAETYSVLTRLPGDARVDASDAVALIDANFAAPLQLGARSSRSAHRELARRGIAGGATYDGLVALAAREHGAVLATRDARARSTYEALGVVTEVLAHDR